MKNYPSRENTEPSLIESVDNYIYIKKASFILFVCPHIKNIWHFWKTTVLSFGSVCTSWLSVAACVKQKCFLQPKTHGFVWFTFCSLVDSEFNRFLTTVESSSLGVGPRPPRSDSLGLVTQRCVLSSVIFQRQD